MTATATGPLVKTGDLPEYTANLARILQENAVEHVRTAAEIALNLLTNPDSASTTLRSVCSIARVDPYAPLVESLPTAFTGWAQHESVSTLVPVQGGWVITSAVESVRKAAALLGNVENLPVTGPNLQLTFDTGYPHWLTVEELAQEIDVDVETLTSSPAQIRNAPGLPAGPATSGQILRLLEDNTFGMREHDARRHAAEARQNLWHMAADSYLAAGQVVPDVVLNVGHETDLLDAALHCFRAVDPDPTDLDSAVELAVRLVYEAGQAKLTRDLVRSAQRSSRVRSIRPPAKRKAIVDERRR